MLSNAFSAASAALLMAVAITSAVASVQNLGSVMPNQNFPDVNIQWDNGKWYAFATKTNEPNTPNVPVAVSDDYKTWNVVKDADGKPFDALPALPKWARTDDKLRVWDPDVVKLDDGSWVMYVAFGVGTGSKHCLGVATSKNLRGPYKVVPKFDKEPWICPDKSNGAFGVSGFKNWDVKGDWGLPADSNSVRRDNCGKNVNGKCGNSYVDAAWSEGGHGGKRYVLYKIQNADQSKGPNTKTPLTIQQVSGADGYTLIGRPTRLMDNKGKADAHSIEGPTIYKTPKGKFVFFFARGNTALPHYATGYAVADKLMGPYVRKGDVLKTGTAGLIAPGAMDVSWNGWRITFHAIPKLPYQKFRVMHAGTVEIDNHSGEVTVLTV